MENNYDTPLCKNAFDLGNDKKIEQISYHFEQIMKIMGLDLEDDSLKQTPNRVAKMYINEIFSGLDPLNKPKISLFENKFNYNKMLVEKNITVHSNCEHHFVPIIGKAHVAYIAKNKIIGLSKINRIVEYFSKRPQIQERLTVQISKELQNILETPDVGVVIVAKHMCVVSRGVQDVSTDTVTSQFSGAFENEDIKTEFWNNLKRKI